MSDDKERLEQLRAWSIDRAIEAKKAGEHPDKTVLELAEMFVQYAFIPQDAEVIHDA